jgi:hypothetical protein
MLQNITLQFNVTSCKLICNNTTITCGEKIENLYYLLVKVITNTNILNTQICIINNTIILYKLLYKRMGYINAKAISYLLKNTILKNSYVTLPTKSSTIKKTIVNGLYDTN